MRALAKKLELSPAFVSKVFSGVAELPLSRVKDFARALKLDDMGEKALLETYIDHHTLQFLKQETPEKRQKIDLTESREIPDKHHFLLSKWYYLAILDLTLVRGYDGTTQWLTKHLRVPPAEVESAFQFLKANGFLVEKDGKWVKVDPLFRFPVIESREVIRKFHSMMLQMAIQHMNSRTTQADYQQRLISGFLFVGSKNNVQRAKIRMNDAMLEIVQILKEEPKTPDPASADREDCVFYFGNVFFPLTDVVK